MSHPFTVRELFSFLSLDPNKVPAWPGDVFAVCASLAQDLGLVTRLGRDLFKNGFGVASDSRYGTRSIQKVANEWRLLCSAAEPSVPNEVLECWHRAFSRDNLKVGVPQLVQPTFNAICEDLLWLCVLCDEVFEGVATIPPALRGAKGRVFWDIAADLLIKRNGATLCHAIDVSRCRVLPKAQTPSPGLSFRSLTRYIGLSNTPDLPVHWKVGESDRFFEEEKCNVLVVPWPFTVTPRNFYRKGFTGNAVEQCSGNWFGYRPPLGDPLDGGSRGLLVELHTLVMLAELKYGRVHMIVLPEAAITADELRVIECEFLPKGIVIISGVVGSGSEDQKSMGDNKAIISLSRPGRRIEQPKHHRWRLDASQIATYGLASILDPNKTWWEGIEVQDRKLWFVSFRQWLCTCVLVCEDLARLDPAGQVIRAVAPDLVIALLFDGPQLTNRWPAYYATVLTDDPGSSVLTVTSLGMSKLSRPRHLRQPDENSTVIGLWRDQFTGTTELKLPENGKAVFLALVKKNSSCSTADGRTVSIVDGAPMLGSVSYL